MAVTEAATEAATGAATEAAPAEEGTTPEEAFAAAVDSAPGGTAPTGPVADAIEDNPYLVSYDPANDDKGGRPLSSLIPCPFIVSWEGRR